MKRRVTETLLTAAGCVIAGALSAILTMPAGHGSIAWLPAGISLAAMLIWGYHVWIGVALGHAVFHALYIATQNDIVAMAVLLALACVVILGAVMQAVLGAWLVRRLVGSPGPLDTVRGIVRFLLFGCVLPSFINALGIQTLFVLASVIDPGAFLETLGRWCLESVLGCVIAAPVLLTLQAEPRELWRSRRVPVGATLLGLLALIITSHILGLGREPARVAGEYERRAARLAQELTLHFRQRLDTMHAVASLVQIDGPVEPRILAQFTDNLFDVQGDVQVLEWLPRVPRAESVEPGAIMLSDEPGFHYPVRFASRADQAGIPTSMELGATRELAMAMQGARDTGLAMATAPVELPQGGGVERYLFVVLPVYEPRALGQDQVSRQRDLRGFVAGVISVRGLVEDALQEDSARELNVQLWDRTVPGQAQALYTREAGKPIRPIIEKVARTEIAGRHWTVALTPTMAAIQLEQSWSAPMLMTAYSLVAMLVCALMLLVTGHAARLQAQAVDQARALNHAERALEQSRVVRRLAESDIVGIVLSDKHGRIYESNDAFLAMIGYGREEFENGVIRWDEVTPDEWKSVDRRAVEQAGGVSGLPAWEKEFLRKDGTRVPVMIGIARLDGPEEHYACCVVDLTRVKAAEAELKRQTAELERYAAELERYKIIVNSTPVSILAKEYRGERQGVYFLANPMCYELVNVDRFEGRTDHDIFPREIAEQFQANDREVLSRGEPITVEERAPDSRTGKLRYALSTRVPLLDAEGKPYAVACIAMDITEHKQLTGHLGALLDAIPDLIFRMNAEGVYLDFKGNRGNSLGLMGEIVIGKSIREVPKPEPVQRLTMDAIHQALATGDMQQIEYSLGTPMGLRDYEARIVKSGNDEVVVLVRDITEARRTRAALEATNAKLRMANEELKEFAYVASHDLQEPLRTVRSFVELLERRYQDAFDERGKKWLEFITSGTQRMRALIDDLLAYSRAGQIGQVEAVDTGVIVRELLDDMQAGIEAAQAELLIGELPVIVANKIELRQVFQNLISNALKFRRLDVRLRISITAEPVGHGWSFTVSDNGIGIEPEYQERIFLVFQRLHGRDQYPGTGIGLALVKKIVERRDGEIRLTSAPGQGSTFQFKLPAISLDDMAG